MSLWKIAWRSISERRLASFLTAFSMALGVALVITVLVIHSVVQNYFAQTATGYNIIVGAKGGKLQLVLNTVYHLSEPIENIPWSFYKEFKPGGKHADVVEWAIPCCMGDNYQGYRVVGTVPELFDDVEYSPGKKFAFRAGHNFKQSEFFTAVIGDLVARNTGLKVGDDFNPTHSLGEGGHQHDAFKVVGILAPTGTATDRALFVNMEGFYLLEDHAKPVPAEPAAEHDEADHDHADEPHEHAEGEPHQHAEGEEHAAEPHEHAEGEEHEHAEHAHDEHDEHAHDEHDHHDHAGHDHDHPREPLPENQREVTAILVKTVFPFGVNLPNEINEGNVAQAVSPQKEITDLFAGIVSNLQKILLMLAWLIVIVAGIGVMVSIYNSMNERRREIAIMRALGAGRQTVLLVVLLESVLLSLLGGLLGLILGHGLIALISPIVASQTGVSIGAFQLAWSTYQIGDYQVRVIWELALIPVLVVLASLAGFVPAMNAYRTDVAKALTATP